MNKESAHAPGSCRIGAAEFRWALVGPCIANDNIRTYPPGDLLHNFDIPEFMLTVYYVYYDKSET